MTDPIRVGIAGYGMAGSVFHAPLIDAADDFALVALSTGNEERIAQATARYRGVHVEPTAEAVLARDDLDLVVIATPNKAHAPTALSAIRRGLHVVVDKPVATTAVDARAIERAAAAKGVVASVFHNRRWDGDFLTIKRLMDEGLFGEVRRFQSNFDRWRPELKGGWRESGDPAEAGGLLFDLGSHLVDQAVNLFGRATSVYAEAFDRRGQIDDDSFIALRHLSGVQSHLTMSAVTPLMAPRFRVLGSTNAYVKFGLDPQEDALKAGGVPGAPGWGMESANAWGMFGTIEDNNPVETVAGDYPAFYRGVARAIRGQGLPPVTLADAVHTLDVIEAARRSAREGTTVEMA